jgi:hypothetical protein
MVMAPVRTEGWPLRLSAYLKERRDMPFIWGDNDCMSFAAGAVMAVTGGYDFLDRWRGYHTEQEAAAILKAYGGMGKIITAGMGIEPHSNVLRGARGDVVLFRLHGMTAAGVVDDTGSRVAAVSTGKKLVRLPLRLACNVWSY